MKEILFLVVLYVALSLIVATYSYLKDQSKDSEPSQKRNEFWFEFFSSILALILFPLLMNAIGNTVLSKFIAGEYTPYNVLELIAYACAVALASRSAIKAGIDSLKLKNVKNDIDKRKEEIQEIEKDQYDIIVKQASVDLSKVELDSDYVGGLQEISKNLESSDLVMIKDQALEAVLLKAEENRHVHIYGQIQINEQVKCKLTKLGRAYLERKTGGNFN